MSRILSTAIALLLILLATVFASEQMPTVGMKVPNEWKRLVASLTLRPLRFE